MTAQVQPRLTPEQYLEMERAAEFRHEYFNGRVYAMAGGKFNHSRVSANLIRTLGNAVEAKPCEVASSDLRVCVSHGGLYTYADALVICGQPIFAEGQSDTLTNPVLICEVLSPSTEAYDRGFKFAQYREIATLREYVLVSQFEPRIEVFTRQENSDWLLCNYIGSEKTCALKSIDCSISLADVFKKIDFSASDSYSNSDHPSPLT